MNISLFMGAYTQPYTSSLAYYKYDRDYSYLNIRYFSNHKELYKRIIDSVNSGEKWLVFIDNRKECQKLADRLIDIGKLDGDEDVYVIDSSSKNEKDYEELITNEKFEQKILISTSVIDNGINFKDPKLLNIVVSDISKDKILQMLGRKRREDKDKHGRDGIVNLYIKKADKREVERQLEHLENHSNAYHLHDIAYNYDPEGSQPERGKYKPLQARMNFNNKYYNGKGHDFKDAVHWFYRDEEKPEYVKQNKLARPYVREVLIPRYKYILKRMEETESNQEFIEHQLSWFGRSIDEISVVAVEDKDKLESDNTAKMEFIEYVKGLAGRIITKDEKYSFKMEFFNKYNPVYGFREEDNEYRAVKEGYGMKVLNDIFLTLQVSLKVVADGSSWVVKNKG